MSKFQALDYPTPAFPHRADLVSPASHAIQHASAPEFLILLEALHKHALNSIEVSIQHSPFFFRCHLQHTHTWEYN
jgi:hypothetical protein